MQNMNDKLYINEIFYSLDGEGSRAGFPAVFVRLAGCNLRCDYCDTTYAMKEDAGEEMTIAQILNRIGFYHCDYITLTGGEPLLNDTAFELVKAMDEAGYHVTIETNGSVDISKALDHASICMDWKTPSSGMNDDMLKSNLRLLRPQDVLKIVLRRSDLSYTDVFIHTNILSCPIYLSPVYGEIPLDELAEYVKLYRGQNKIRMQLQIHKIIWSPNKRGV